MLQVFRNNNPYTVIILLICTILLKLQVLLHPQLPQPVQDYFVYNGVLTAFGFVFRHSAFAYTLLAVVMIFLQAIYFKGITVRHRLYPRHTYVPALVYILLSSIYPAFSFFSSTLLVNWCLLGAMDMILTFSHTNHPRKDIFNAGFILCIAALLQFPALFFIIMLIAGMILLRPFSPGEVAVGIMGYLTPFYFFAGIMFIIDQFPQIGHWPNLGLAIPGHLRPISYFIVLITGLVLLLVMGIIAMQQQVPKTAVYTRRSWLTLTIYLFISVITALSTDLYVHGAWFIIVPPISLVITHAYSMEKSKVFSNIALGFFLLYVILCQYLVN